MIVVQPSSRLVEPCERATFLVGLSGTRPMALQWYRNGEPIPGATGDALVLPSVDFGDNGASLFLVASNSYGVAISSNAFLFVLGDVSAPALRSAEFGATPDEVILRFSRYLWRVPAEDPLNYQFDDQSTVLGARLGRDAMTVVLRVEPQFGGQEHTVGARDLVAICSSLSISADTRATLRRQVLTRGFLQRNYYRDLGMVSLSNVLHNPRFLDAPDLSDFVTSFSTSAGQGPISGPDSSMGIRLRGYLLPPATGDYVFYLIGYSAPAALYFSADEDPGGKELVLATDGSGGVNNLMDPVTLVSGRRYYVEVVLNGAGYDWEGAVVRWREPGAAEFKLIPGEFLAAYADPESVDLRITRQPEGRFFVDGPVPATFTVAAEVTPAGPISYQWQRNGVDIPGSNNASLTLGFGVGKRGDRFRCLVSTPGRVVVSDEAIYDYQFDDEPDPDCAYSLSISNVVVEFPFTIEGPGYPVLPGTPTNFSIDSGVTVLATATWEDDAVSLTTTPMVLGQHYQVTAVGLTNRDGMQWTRPVSFPFRAQNVVGSGPWRTLRESFRYPVDVESVPGMRCRVHAIGVSATNSWARAETQLGGTWLDPATGLPYPNLAVPPGLEYLGPVNFSLQPGGAEGVFAGDCSFPGLPASDGSTDGVVMELFGYAELDLGVHRWGVRSRDGFRLEIVPSPGLGASSVVGEALDATTVTVEFKVCRAGYYPVRLLWWQDTGGAELEWWAEHVGDDPANPNRVLINSGRPDAPRVLLPTGLVSHPRARIESSGGVPEIRWEGLGFLQEFGLETGSWNEILGATSPHPVDPVGSGKIYRVRFLP